MPIAKYFATIGGLLIAVLFIANWYFPEPAVAFPGPGIEKATIRIESACKWPEKIVFDTSQPMPKASNMADTERLAQPILDTNAGKSGLQAFAKLKQPLRLAATSHARRWHKVKSGHRLTYVVMLR